MCHSTSGAKISVGKLPVKQNASYSTATLARLAFPDRWVCEIISLVQWSQFLDTLLGDSRGWPDRLVGLDGDIGEMVTFVSSRDSAALTMGTDHGTLIRE